MAQLGFLGLGIMGYPMAQHLLAAGHDVALWSKTRSKAEQLAATGRGIICETPQDVAARSEVTFLCVGDTAMSEEVLFGAQGIASGVQAGKVVVDSSTVSPSHAKSCHARFASQSVDFLDAPVTGSKAGAEGGTLTFMVGGDAAVFARVKPFFENMGKQLYHCGGPGLGLHAKLTQNLILSNIMQAMSEGMVLSTKSGVDPELMLDILTNSAARTGLATAKMPAILRRDWSTNFSTRWMEKDIQLMLESGSELQVPLPLTSVTQQMFRAALAKGYAEDDFCGMIRILEDWAGVEVKK